MSEPDGLLESDRGRDVVAVRLRALIPSILKRREVAQALARKTEHYHENSPARRAHALESIVLCDYALGPVLAEYSVLQEVVLDLIDK